jgi:hypothetical protein
MLSQLMSNPAIVEIISGPLDGVPADVQRAVARACAVAVIAALQLPTAAPGGAAGAGAIVEQCIGALGGRFKAHEKLPEVARAFAHAKLRGELSDAAEPLPDVPPTPEALFASARWALRRGDFVGGVKLLLDVSHARAGARAAQCVRVCVGECVYVRLCARMRAGACCVLCMGRACLDACLTRAARAARAVSQGVARWRRAQAAARRVWRARPESP